MKLITISVFAYLTIMFSMIMLLFFPIYIVLENFEPKDSIPTPITTQQTNVPMQVQMNVPAIVLSCPDNILEVIKTQSLRHEIDWKVVYCIIGYESGFKPNKITRYKNEESYGLLQVNIRSNYPSGDDKYKLLDSNYNLDYQLDELKIFYDIGIESNFEGVKLIEYVSKYGQRPDWGNAGYIIKTVNKYWLEVKDYV